MNSITIAVLLGVACARAAVFDDTPWPLPSDCIVTDPQELYSTRTDYFTFRDPRPTIPNEIKLALVGDGIQSPSFLASKYPDPLALSGEGASRLKNVHGGAVLNTATGHGHIEVEFDVDEAVMLGRLPYDQNLTGHFKVVSTDFKGWGSRLVPFQTHVAEGKQRFGGPNGEGAISGNFIQHGCSGQGEPGFPNLRSKVSSWGHGDVYLNGKLLYRNIWLHSMYTERYRDPITGAVYANDDHSEIFSPKKCSGKANYPAGDNEFSLVVARWCQDPNPKKIHATTDMDMLLSFSVKEL